MYYMNGNCCENKYRTPQTGSYIRFLNASPNAGSLDFYVNNIPTSRNIGYQGFSPYVPLSGGLYNIKAYRRGQTTSPLIDMNVNIPPRTIFTMAATGMEADIDLTLVQEPPISRLPKETFVRVAHLSPNAPHVDITTPDGTRLFSDVEYKEITDYIRINPGVYELQARAAGTDNIVLRVPNINLRSGNIYTIYVVGLLEGRPPLQVLIPLDGSTYLKV